MRSGGVTKISKKRQMRRVVRQGNRVKQIALGAVRRRSCGSEALTARAMAYPGTVPPANENGIGCPIPF